MDDSPEEPLGNSSTEELDITDEPLQRRQQQRRRRTKPQSARKPNLCNAIRHQIISLYNSGHTPTQISKISASQFGEHIDRSTVKNITNNYVLTGQIEAKPKGGARTHPVVDRFTRELNKQLDTLKVEQIKELPSNWSALPASQRKHLLQTVIKPAISDYIDDRFQMAIAFAKFPIMKELQFDTNNYFGTALSIKSIIESIRKQFYLLLESVPLATEPVTDIPDRVANYRQFLLNILKVPETEILSSNTALLKVPETVIFIREHLFRVKFWSKVPVSFKVTTRDRIVSLTFAFTSSQRASLDTRVQDSRLTLSDWKEFLEKLSLKVQKTSTFVVFNVTVFHNESIQNSVKSWGHSLEFLLNEKTFCEPIDSAVLENEHLQEAQSEAEFLEQIKTLVTGNQQFINWKDYCTEMINTLLQRYIALQLTFPVQPEKSNQRKARQRSQRNCNKMNI